jgi:hypothetical protein
VGWRDRDWARFSDEERQLVFGAPSVQAFDWLRVCVWSVTGLLALVVAGYSSRALRHTTVAAPSPEHVVYAGPTLDQGRLACTAESANATLGMWVCTEWTIVETGQTTAKAVDPGGQCGVRHVDQATHRWVCDSETPPDPQSLPRPQRGSPESRGTLSQEGLAKCCSLPGRDERARGRTQGTPIVVNYRGDRGRPRRAAQRVRGDTDHISPSPPSRLVSLSSGA